MAERRSKRLVNLPDYKNLTNEQRREARRRQNIELFALVQQIAKSEQLQEDERLSDDSSDEFQSFIAEDMANVENNANASFAGSSGTVNNANNNPLINPNPTISLTTQSIQSPPNTTYVQSITNPITSTTSASQLPYAQNNSQSTFQPFPTTQTYSNASSSQSNQFNLADLQQMFHQMFASSVDAINSNGTGSNRFNSSQENRSTSNVSSIGTTFTPPPPPIHNQSPSNSEVLQMWKIFPLDLPLDSSLVIRKLQTWESNLPAVSDAMKLALARTAFAKWPYQSMVTDITPDVVQKTYPHFKSSLEKAFGRDPISTLTTNAKRSIKELYAAAKASCLPTTDWHDTLDWFKDRLPVEDAAYLESAASREDFENRVNQLMRREAQEKMRTIRDKTAATTQHFEFKSSNDDLLAKFESMLSPLKNELASLKTKELNKQLEKSNSANSSSRNNSADKTDSAIERLEKRIEELNGKLESSCSAVNSQPQRFNDYRSSQQNNRFDPNVCYFHDRFGQNARCCKGQRCPGFSTRDFPNYDQQREVHCTREEFNYRQSLANGGQRFNGNGYQRRQQDNRYNSNDKRMDNRDGHRQQNSTTHNVNSNTPQSPAAPAAATQPQINYYIQAPPTTQQTVQTQPPATKPKAPTEQYFKFIPVDPQTGEASTGHIVVSNSTDFT